MKTEKNKKTKKIKESKYRSEEQKEIIHFIIVLVVVIAVVGIVYGVSKLFIDDNIQSSSDVVPGEINYELVTVGTMFNRDYEEYYVVAYDREDSQAILYSSIMSKYTNEEDSLNVFFCDLSNPFNSNYYVGQTGESNPNAKTIEELALGEFTFIKIKNGKIVKYMENIDDAKKELGV